MPVLDQLRRPMVSSLHIMILLIIALSPSAYGNSNPDKGSGKTESPKPVAGIIPVYYLLGRDIHGLEPASTKVTSSSFEKNVDGQYPPANAYDNDYGTWWSARGRNEWILFTFARPVTLSGISIAFHQGDQHRAIFTVQAAARDGIWTTVVGGQSSGVSTSLEYFPFEPITVSYLRVLAKGNTVNQWNRYTEVAFPGYHIPTCYDGRQNQNEIGIDCGGVCSDSCCTNGFLDQDLGETGIDCGGSCPSCFTGATYYVSSSMGKDDNDGLSPSSAWRTIAKVNQAELEGGDGVLFRRGDAWREELVISRSGSEDAYITFAAYGPATAKPRILGSNRASGWVVVSGYPNIWQSTTPLSIPHVSHPASIFFGNMDGSISWGRVLHYRSVPACDSSFSMLNQEYDWCWDEAVYIFSQQDPADKYRYVEVPQRRGSITMPGNQPQEYITIDGLELMFGTMYGYNDGWPMNHEVRGLNIKNCHIAYIGIRGGDSAMGLVIWHSDMHVLNNDIHDSGRRNISYNVYTDNGKTIPNQVFENVLFENNVLHNGYHTTGFDISHGEGMFDTFRNFTFKNNFIYDDRADNPADGINDFTSMGLYLHPGAAEFTNFKIHNNVLKNIKQKALAIGGVHNLEIFNNVIYGMNPNIEADRAMVQLSGDYRNVAFNNNIIYGTVDTSQFNAWGVLFANGSSGITSLDNNLYYQQDPEQAIIKIEDPGLHSYTMSQWEDYRRDTGRDQHSPPPQNPLFIDPDNNDFRLHPGSAAINQGKNVGLPFNGPKPDIGAYETPGLLY